MSSHHVVKEKQEPGLLILDPAGFDLEYLGQLLEWSPTVVVADTVLAGAGLPDIKVDGVITADPDLPVQRHARRILSRGDPLEAGLRYFLDAGYPALNIILKNFDHRHYSEFAEQI
ncbi:MAG TPA: thiamine pyrophosphokinase, partial [Sphingobacteriaceae bacterium]